VSEFLKGQDARNGFMKFVQQLRGGRARHCTLWDADPPARATVLVKHADAVDCFIANNPQHKPRRAIVASCFTAEPMFSFDAETWNAVQVRT
jgi:hypothetical protein